MKWLVWVLTLTAFALGVAFAHVPYRALFPDAPPPGDYRLWLPHTLPLHAGGTSLRMAMVHDVIHERFVRHGPEFYLARNELSRQRLAAIAGDRKLATERFGLLDDLGAGLAYTGRFDEATKLMRDKLREQLDAGLKGQSLYTTHANLGTFLIIDGILKGLKSDPAAKALLIEGNDHIRTAIAINPDSHFGREIWQEVLIDFLIAAADRKDLLLKYDMVGNRLDAELGDIGSRRPFVRETPKTKGVPVIEVSGALPFAEYPFGKSPHRISRDWITPVGGEGDWAKDVKTSRPKPGPFHEPTLAIVGMWTLGAGANPHFAVALGEMMLRVGQRRIAWCAFERAVLTAPTFFPDAALRDRFVALCRARQKLIEDSLGSQAADLRPTFEAELKLGQDYQARYRKYETDRIAAGVRVDDPKFHDEFFAKEGRIASPPGEADLMITSRYGSDSPLSELPDSVRLATGLLCAGVVSLLGGLWMRRRASRVFADDSESFQ